ncbi:hypothetical protein MPTA5024_24360 [Microbispora sp. ATCC PTA-5024]|nr:hypothetical protein MPTA5024_24360 [Microbispora sp. ATCC PTA-5024]
MDREAPNGPVLTLTEPAAGQILLSWTPATDNVGVAAYDVYVAASPSRLLATVGADQLTYTDYRPSGETVSYYVVARDAAGNTHRSDVVTRPGEGRRPDVSEDSGHSDASGDDRSHRADDEATGRSDDVAGAENVGYYSNHDSRENVALAVGQETPEEQPTAQAPAQGETTVQAGAENEKTTGDEDTEGAEDEAYDADDEAADEQGEVSPPSQPSRAAPRSSRAAPRSSRAACRTPERRSRPSRGRPGR